MPTTLKIHPPLYLASATMDCWKCGGQMLAVTLVSPNNSEDQGNAATLTNIRQMPDALRLEIQKRCPTYQLKSSKMAGSAYYANVCPKCGVITGDYYLHSEPDSPFFPIDEAEAAQLIIEELPLSGPVELDAECGFGTGDVILKHAKKPYAS